MTETLAIFFYSISKIFFLLREIAGWKKDNAAVRRWKIWAWITALIGLPFVTAILLCERDWIFGWLELGSAPAMMLGLIRALRNEKKEVPKSVDRIVYAAVAVGFAWSAADFGTLLSVNQGLETIAVFTFAIGNYLLAKDDRRGYLWFILMFAAAGTLLYRQEHFWFAMQQVGSALVIAVAYVLAVIRTQTWPPRE